MVEDGVLAVRDQSEVIFFLLEPCVALRDAICQPSFHGGRNNAFFLTMPEIDRQRDFRLMQVPSPFVGDGVAAGSGQTDPHRFTKTATHGLSDLRAAGPFIAVKPAPYKRVKDPDIDVNYD
jgi:hypothetical protein